MTDVAEHSSGPSPGPVSSRRRVAPFVALAVALAVGALIVVFARSDGAGEQQATSPVVGGPAPLLVGDSVDGETYDLASRRGRWVVVNFMASWCAPCREEQPELVTFANRHAAAGDAEVVAVVVDDRPDDIEAFFGELGGDWPAVLDPEGHAYVGFGVLKVPETYVVDPDGIVVTKINGRVTADALDAVLTAASEARG